MLCHHEIVLFGLLLPEQFLRNHHVSTQICDFLSEFDIVRLCPSKPPQLFLSELQIATLLRLGINVDSLVRLTHF